MHRSVCFVFAFAALALPATLRAQSSPGFGASASTSLGSCTDTTGTGPCAVQFDRSTIQRYGGQGQDISKTVDYGVASSVLSTTQGDLYLPEIHAAVSTSGNARILTGLTTYQTYQFNGSAPT